MVYEVELRGIEPLNDLYVKQLSVEEREIYEEIKKDATYDELVRLQLDALKIGWGSSDLKLWLNFYHNYQRQYCRTRCTAVKIWKKFYVRWILARKKANVVIKSAEALPLYSATDDFEFGILLLMFNHPYIDEKQLAANIVRKKSFISKIYRHLLKQQQISHRWAPAKEVSSDALREIAVLAVAYTTAVHMIGRWLYEQGYINESKLNSIYKINEDFLLSIIGQESNFRQDAGYLGNYGVMQLNVVFSAPAIASDDRVVKHGWKIGVKDGLYANNEILFRHSIAANMLGGIETMLLKIVEFGPLNLWQLAYYYNGSSHAAMYANSVMRAMNTYYALHSNLRFKKVA